MLKPEVLASPRLYQSYLDTRKRMLSDGSVERNTAYGVWKLERKDVVQACFLGELLTCTLDIKVQSPIVLQAQSYTLSSTRTMWCSKRRVFQREA